VKKWRCFPIATAFSFREGKQKMADTIHFDVKLLRSEAFRGLSKWGLLVYLDFLRMRKMVEVRRDQWLIENNGQLVYPYATAERKGIKRREFRIALDELITKGFLDIQEYGSGGVKGLVTKYRIDERWQRYGKPDFQPAKNPMRKDSRSGRGWQVYNQKKQSSVTKMTPKRLTKMTPEGSSKAIQSIDKIDNRKSAYSGVTN
jgi:hypothetical protein